MSWSRGGSGPLGPSPWTRAWFCLFVIVAFSTTTVVNKDEYTLWTIKGHPFYFGNNLAKCWPNFTIFGRIVAEKICNIFMLCCSPHLFTVVTLLQENKVPFNYACTCESVPLTATIMIIIHKIHNNILVNRDHRYILCWCQLSNE